MPHLRVNGAELHYESAGSGPETVVFSHGLLWSGEMFRAQVRHLSSRYRVVTYDHRGQGRSETTPAGYDMDNLAVDAAGLLEAVGAVPCHFAGLSMGGFVAMRLAARRPELLRSCILLETSAGTEAQAGRFRLLNWAVRLVGARPLVGQVMPILFGRSFLADPARAAERAEWAGRLAALPRSVHRAVAGVIERRAIFDELPRIRVPTLILVGEEDAPTPPAMAEVIRDAVPGSRLVQIPRAGHTSTVENPGAVNAALDAFLGEVSRPDHATGNPGAPGIGSPTPHLPSGGGAW
jgi:pimeloyl-ACP methyl ester carboxylesterase